MGLKRTARRFKSANLAHCIWCKIGTPRRGYATCSDKCEQEARMAFDAYDHEEESFWVAGPDEGDR